MAVSRRRNRSAYRESILVFLQGDRIHATAEEIHRALQQRFPRVSLGTVYRNLGILIEEGRVNRVSVDLAGDRFEACREPHYHVVCEQCGAVSDTSLPVSPHLNRRAARESGYEITRHHIDFFGICARCRSHRA